VNWVFCFLAVILFLCVSQTGNETVVTVNALAPLGGFCDTRMRQWSADTCLMQKHQQPSSFYSSVIIQTCMTSQSDDSLFDLDGIGNAYKFDKNDSGDVPLDDLTWRVEKLRLEEANIKRFLKSGPRFLPYDECRKWVQAWGSRWSTEQEWKSWIATGEKRNPYIPSRPNEYYGKIGKWVSWEHFLGTDRRVRDESNKLLNDDDSDRQTNSDKAL
jgi:hypothetical protein